LQNGVDWSIELDVLSRAFLRAEHKPRDWPILQAEQRAMQQLDIPYFGTYSNSNALSLGLEQPIKKYFEQPSYQQALTRLQQLDQADLAQQVATIRGSFEARFSMPLITGQQSIPIDFRGDDWSQIDPLASSQLLQKAQTIAQEVQQRAVRLSGGRFTW